MTAVLIRRVNRDTDTQGSLEEGGEDMGSRHWGDASTNQGMPRIASSHQKLSEAIRFFLRTPRRNQPANTNSSDF